ncbi:hypothetical protein SK128_005850 [Halocaridina rubra]|uniref:SET domain-containing protein n=1 Tax=Halocaridina rubra TaxID=373956 RepID=A0AAN9A9E4_HALRR
MKPLSVDDLMRKFNSEIGKERLTAIMGDFNASKSTEEMFKNFWKMEEAQKNIIVSLNEKTKSFVEATRLRNEGDDYFHENSLDEALYVYNLCLMSAPHPPIDICEDAPLDSTRCNVIENGPKCSCGDYELLYHSYGKRSAVLFVLKQYDLCLRDIILASVCSKLRKELENRKKKCMERMKSHNNNSRSVISSLGENISSIPKISECNPIMPSFSRACKVAYRPEKGRYVIADRPIKPGEVLLVEKAYCANLYENNHSTHCATCLRECIAPLPCPECTMAVFCSISCRQDGLSGMHRLECPVLTTLYAMDLMPVFGNAYKLLSIGSCKTWRQCIKELEKRANECSPEERGRNECGIYCSEDMNSAYNLSPNIESRPCEDLYTKCFIAFVLNKFLLFSKRFFVDDCGRPHDPSEDDLIFAGQLLFSNLMKVSSNGVSTASFQNTHENYLALQYPGSTFSVVQQDVGSGIYPSIGLINHSCYPSVIPYPYGRYYVLRAGRALMPSQEITLGYCRGSYLMPIKDRQATLFDRYQFACNCEACEEEWPVYEDLPESLTLRCSACSHPVRESDPICLGCNMNYAQERDDESDNKVVNTWRTSVEEIKTAMSNLNNVREIITRGACVSQCDFSSLCNAIEVLQRHVVPPSRTLWDAKETLELYFHLENYLALKQGLR